MNVAAAALTQGTASFSGAWVGIFDLLLKTTLLLVAALLLDWVLRKRRPVTCAAMWNAALLALVALPVAQWCLPKTAVFQDRPANTLWSDNTSRRVRTLEHSGTAPSVAPVEITSVPAAIAAADVAPPQTPDFRPQPAPAPLLMTPPSAPAPYDVATTMPASPRESIVPQEPPVSALPDNAAAVEATSQPSWPLASVAVIAIYALGFAVSVLRLLGAMWAAARLRRRAEPATDEPWLRRLAEWQERLGLSTSVELRVSAAERIPLVVGWRKPAIILPADVVASAQPSVRDAVLLHELTHVARNDYAWQLLGRWLQAALWFHPLLWAAAKRIHYIRERVCDAFSVHGLGGTQVYADALLQMAGRLTRRPSLSLGLAVARSSKLGERLSAIFESGGSSRYCPSRPGRAGALMAACATAALLGHTALAQVSVPRQPGLPAAAGAALSAYEAEANALLQRAQIELHNKRERLVAELQRIQDQYTRAADLDAAVAVRDQIRALRNQQGAPALTSTTTTTPPVLIYTQPGGPPLRTVPPQIYPQPQLPRQTPSVVQPAPADMSGYQDRIGKTFYFQVRGDKNGTVWGTDTYTYDSSVATAAVHSGAVADGETGLILVTLVPGPREFAGSERNGVLSNDWDNQSGHYYAYQIRRAPTLHAYPAELPDPGTLTEYASRIGDSLSFRVVGFIDGGAWGTGLYTHDTDLSTAVVHAGLLAVGEEGIVRVTMLRGPKKFHGSQAHNVLSNDWENDNGFYSGYRVELVARRPPVLRTTGTLLINPPTTQLDPGTLTEYRGRIGEQFLFQVTGTTDHVIWGTDVYTDDSALATAAVHAGVLKAGDTGFVLVTILPGREWYRDSTRNGVQSADYGPFEGSYRVDAVPASPGGSVMTVPQPMHGDSVSHLRGRNGESFLFEIVGNKGGDWPALWGTEIYTDDSSLGAAAVHAGLLQEGERGVVKVTILPGRDHYTGSLRNGVASRDWANFDGSFEVSAVTPGETFQQNWFFGGSKSSATPRAEGTESETLRTGRLKLGNVVIEGATDGKLVVQPTSVIALSPNPAAEAQRSAAEAQRQYAEAADFARQQQLLAIYRSKLVTACVEEQALLQTLGEKHPQVVEMRRQIAEIVRIIRETEATTKANSDEIPKSLGLER